MRVASGGTLTRADQDCTFHDEVFPLRSNVLRDSIYDEPIMHQKIFESPARKPHSIPKVASVISTDSEASDPADEEILDRYVSSIDAEDEQDAPMDQADFDELNNPSDAMEQEDFDELDSSGSERDVPEGSESQEGAIEQPTIEEDKLPEHVADPIGIQWTALVFSSKKQLLCQALEGR
jgi:hypothetical protein